MLKLTYYELYKLFRQSRTYYALGAVFAIELIVLFSAYYQGGELIDILLDNLKRSFYFEGTLLNGNLLVYLMLNSLWFHIPLILMIVVSGMLTSEYKDRTLQTVFLQPVSKLHFILGKYFAAIVFTVIAILFLSLSSIGLSYILFGQGDLIVFMDALNIFEANTAIIRILYAFAVGTFSMIFFAVVSITIATLLKEATKTWIVAAFFLLVCMMLTNVNVGIQWFDSYSFTKINNTWQYFFYDNIPWSKIALNIVLLILYSILTMGIGIFSFQKKDIG